MREMWERFWAWYDRNYTLNVSIAAGLFLLQLVHLVWLGGEVATLRALGTALFDLTGMWETLIIVVDYTELPAIFTMTLVYIDAWRRGSKWNAVLMLALLHSQWMHIFWITDEFIVTTLSEPGSTILPNWLAWIAILIDYLEVPVVFDTLIKLGRSLREKRGLEGIKQALNEA
ncbi:hypothetical protein CL652_02350 [bacterium]|nr:hypothetical protein [bacterium]|tara:strand:+ start:9404 stop:9922 length:519 start_codon:yes stop_codon:yes gene_type:complete